MTRLVRAAVPSAALAGLVLLNKWLVDREVKPAEADGGRVLELPGGDLHVLEEGSPDAPPVVLVHGFAGSMRWFDRFAPLLAADHRVIRVDLLGHGGSSKPASGYGLDDQARLVGLALDRLGVERALLVGHSMGAAVGVSLAGQRPELVRALVVVDEGPDNSFGDFPLISKVGFVPVIGELLHRVAPDSAVRDGFRDAFAKGFDLADGFPDPDQVVRDYRRMTYTSYKASEHAEDEFLRSERLDSRLKRTGLPALVLFGEQDTFFRAEESARAFEGLPGVRVEVVPGVGHSIAVEAPERLVELVRELEGAAASAPAA
jgi:pimeloyl-ACP methyl ester carboxylesterase